MSSAPWILCSIALDRFESKSSRLILRDSKMSCMTSGTGSHEDQGERATCPASMFAAKSPGSMPTYGYLASTNEVHDRAPDLRKLACTMAYGGLTGLPVHSLFTERLNAEDFHKLVGRETF